MALNPITKIREIRRPYNDRINTKGQKFRYFIKYLILGKTYTFFLYIIFLIKKIIFLRF